MAEYVDMHHRIEEDRGARVLSFQGLVQACGMDLKEAADWLGIAHDTAKKYSAGQAVVPAAHVLRLAGLLRDILDSGQLGKLDTDMPAVCKRRAGAIRLAVRLGLPPVEREELP